LAVEQQQQQQQVSEAGSTQKKCMLRSMTKVSGIALLWAEAA